MNLRVTRKLPNNLGPDLDPACIVTSPCPPAKPGLGSLDRQGTRNSWRTEASKGQSSEQMWIPYWIVIIPNKHRCPFCTNRRCHLPSFTFCWFIWDTPSIYHPTRDKRTAMPINPTLAHNKLDTTDHGEADQTVMPICKKSFCNQEMSNWLKLRNISASVPNFLGVECFPQLVVRWGPAKPLRCCSCDICGSTTLSSTKHVSSFTAGWKVTSLEQMEVSKNWGCPPIHAFPSDFPW